MRLFFAALIGIFTFGGELAAATTLLHCGKLIDVRTQQVVAERTVVVEDTRIVRVDAGFTSPDGEAEVIDLESHTCIPGLMDLHVHLSSEQNPNATVQRFTLNAADFAYRSVGNARKTLMAGFTTVRDVGSVYGVNVSLRNAINQRLIDGPRMFVSGNLSSTGGPGDPTNGWRGDIMGDPGPDDGIINSPEEARKAVRQRYKEGVNMIKIHATGAVLSLTTNGDGPQMTEDEMRAIVETAADYGFHVAAHAHGAEGIKRAVRAGVRSIEHGTLADDEAIELMRQAGTYLVPTISAGEFVSEKAKIDGFFPEIIREKAASIGPKSKSTFSRAYKAGVNIAFGTDAGVPAHGDNGREFEYMVEAGMPPLEAIRAATLSAATLLEVEDRLGTIEPGKLANIIAVPEDPTQNISIMEHVSFVMKEGVVFKRP